MLGHDVRPETIHISLNTKHAHGVNPQYHRSDAGKTKRRLLSIILDRRDALQRVSNCQLLVMSLKTASNWQHSKTYREGNQRRDDGREPKKVRGVMVHFATGPFGVRTVPRWKLRIVALRHASLHHVKLIWRGLETGVRRRRGY